MLNLHTWSSEKEKYGSSLSAGEKFSVYYHNIFDFPLDYSDLIKWTAGKKAYHFDKNILFRGGFFFLEGKDGLIYKRNLRKRISAKKTLIAEKSAKLISLVPFVKMVSITGSLAMENSNEDDDIDLLIITKKGTLWLSRLIVHMVLKIAGIKVRRAKDSSQKDKLCINMWVDEDNVAWTGPRTFYTAHEIAQVKPIVDRENTYELFIQKNRWILDFWPGAVKISETNRSNTYKVKKLGFFLSLFERAAFWVQYRYMQKRITIEAISPGRAFFHPQDLGKFVSDKLSS